MQKPAAYLIVGQHARALAFEPTQQRDAEAIPLYTASSSAIPCSSGMRDRYPDWSQEQQ